MPRKPSFDDEEEERQPRCAYCGRPIGGVPVERGGQLFDSEEHAAHAEQGE